MWSQSPGQGKKYQVIVTMSFTSTWYFSHNDLNRIKDTVTRQFCERIKIIEKIFPMLRFKEYEWSVKS